MAQKATLINSAGKKVVVDTGTSQAQNYFSQGYKLMGAPTVSNPVSSTPKAPVVNSAIKTPDKPTPPANNKPVMITGYDQSGNPVQVPKGVYVPGVSLTPKKITADSFDVTKDTKYQELLKKNEELAKAQSDLSKKQADAGTTAASDQYSTNLTNLANEIKSNLTQTFTPEQQSANKTALINKQNEINKFNIDTNKAVSNVDFNPNLLTSQVGKSQAQIQREASFKSEALSAEETNLINMVNLSDTEKQALINGDVTIAGLQDKIQTHVDQAKQDVLTQAQALDKQHQDALATAISAYAGIDPDKMTAEQTASFTKIITDAGLDPSLVFQGIKAVNAQKTLDTNIKTNAAKTPQVIGEHYDENSGTMVKDYGYVDPTTGKLVTTSGQSYTPGIAPTDTTGNDSGKTSVSNGGKMITTASGDSYDMSTYASDQNQAKAVQAAIDDAGTFKSPAEIDNYIANTKGSPLNSSIIMTAAYGNGVSPEALAGLIRHESIMGTSDVAKNNNNVGGITWSQSYQDSHPGTTKGTARPEGGNYVKFSSLQEGTNAAAEQLANRKATSQGASSTDQQKYAQYGLLANTDFNPKDSSDKTAKLYLDYYLKTATFPTSYNLGLGRGAGAANKFANASDRAQDLFFKATGSSLPDANILKDNKKIVTDNNKVLNKNEILADTVKKNFDLAIDGEITNDINKNSTVVNQLLNPLYLAMGNPAVNAAMVSNGTISQEFANLISIRNASGTTVSDKEVANELIKFGTSVDAQKEVVKRLKAEALNIKTTLEQQNSYLYSIVDPLETANENPNRALKITGKTNNNFTGDLSQFETKK